MPGVPTTTSVFEYDLTGAADYAVPFVFLDQDHLRVTWGPTGVENPLTRGPDYMVLLPAPVPNTGSIHLLNPGSLSGKLRIQRVTPLLQPEVLSGSTQFAPEAVERIGNRSRLIEQELAQQLADGIVPVGSFVHGLLPGNLHERATALSDGVMSKEDFAKLAGYPDDPAELVPTSLETTGNITLYVSTSGDDANDGLSTGTPLRNIQTAIDRIPYIIRHNVTINVAAGTYNEQLRIDKHFAGTTAAKLAIVGALQNFTPFSGIASGTITSMTGRVITVTGAGWTANDLRDKFLRLTATGALHPIAGNTSDTIEVPTNVALSGAFDIVEPSVIIAGGNSGKAIWSTSSSGFTASASFGLNVSNVELTGDTCGFAYGGVLRLSGVRCKYRSYGLSGTYGAAFSCSRVILLEQAAFNGAAIDVENAQHFLGDEVYARGVAVGTNSGLLVRSVNEVFINLSGILIFEGFGYGMYANNSVGYVFSNGLVLRNGNYGLYVFGAGFAMEGGPFEATDNLQYGIFQEDGSLDPTQNVHIGLTDATITGNLVGGVLLRDYASLSLQVSGSVSGSGGDGIRLAGVHSTLRLGGTVAVGGNGGWGVKCHGNATMNVVEVGDSVVMGSNASGDFTADGGTTAKTLAALRAITTPIAKRWTEADFLNVIYGL